MEPVNSVEHGIDAACFGMRACFGEVEDGVCHKTHLDALVLAADAETVTSNSDTFYAMDGE